MENERNQCRKCGGNAIPSKALMNYHYIDKSYHRGEKEFETKLLDCLKCSSCGHSWVPIKSTQELAFEWWESEIEKIGLSYKYGFDGNINRTLEEIEEIWLKETNILQRQSTRQKQMQLNVTNCGNKNCQNGVINGITPRICKKCNPFNAKQFKEFNHGLSSAYLDKFDDKGKMEFFKLLIDKFSDKDKYKALRILAESFGLNFEFNNSFTSIWNRTLE